jgi:hypothetical protein
VYYEKVYHSIFFVENKLCINKALNEEDAVIRNKYSKVKYKPSNTTEFISVLLPATYFGFSENPSLGI